MQVSRDQLMEHGYIILQNVIPPDRLDRVRRAVERMVERRQEISRQRRTPDEPPGGSWEASAQPRLSFDRDVDVESTAAFECLLNENTLGVCRQIIDAQHVAPHNFNCLCSPVSRDFGPATWHRDIAPGDPAPLRGMIANMMAHGPSYLQWNIALYDDSVFWIVPKSHLRVNTGEENRQLAENPGAPLPGGMPVELKAGDGVVYTHLLLHWGSNYSRKLRRGLHPGYRPFGYRAIPNVHWRHWEPGFYHHLAPDMRAQFETWDALYLEEFDQFARVFKAMIKRDADAFYAGFRTIHPSPQEAMVSLVMLCKLAGRLYRLKHTPAPASHLWGNGRDMTYLGNLFTADEAADLQARFSALDERLKFQDKRGAPGFQGDQSIYNPNDMPEDFGIEDLVASWHRPSQAGIRT